MSISTSRRGTALLAAIGALLLAAFAAAPQAEAATIYGCVKKKGGTIHIVTKKAKCKKGETKLSWNTPGPAGPSGAPGKEGPAGKEGAIGKEGAAGQPQKAVAFNVTTDSSPVTTTLFSLGGAAVRLECFNFIANFAEIQASAPAGSHAESGMVFTNSSGKPPEIEQESIVADVALTPAFTKVTRLSTNVKAPLTNIAHVNMSIATPTSVVLMDAFIQAAPSPSACTVRGMAFSIPT